MRRLVIILALALAAGFASYHFTPAARTTAPMLRLTFPATRLIPATPAQQLTWLREEFHLNDAQFAKIRQLHADYLPVCAEHCRRIMIAQDKLSELKQSGQEHTALYTATQSDWEDLKAECDAATLAHLHAVAAVMNPADGRRYLAMMEPRVVAQAHIHPLPYQ